MINTSEHRCHSLERERLRRFIYQTTDLSPAARLAGYNIIQDLDERGVTWTYSRRLATASGYRSMSTWYTATRELREVVPCLRWLTIGVPQRSSGVWWVVRTPMGDVFDADRTQTEQEGQRETLIQLLQPHRPSVFERGEWAARWEALTDHLRDQLLNITPRQTPDISRTHRGHIADIPRTLKG